MTSQTITDEEFYREQFIEKTRLSDLCTPKQAAMLAKLGVADPQNVRFDDVDRIAREARIANIAQPPAQGDGVHKWLLKAARIMHENGFSSGRNHPAFNRRNRAYDPRQ